MTHRDARLNVVTRAAQWRRLAVWLLVAATISGGGYFGFWHYHLKRFTTVRPGVLYRTAQPTEFGLRHLVKFHNVRTVLNLRLQDSVLYRGWLDPGEPSGRLESEYVTHLNARPLQWPMGTETYWPWLTPWQYEQFFELFDQPANLPVAVHCMGGRHRTGTFCALYRLEYEHANIEAVLQEMLSYDFGPLAWLQEHNLRTYRPRPRPKPAQLSELLRGLSIDARQVPGGYEQLIRRLRSDLDDETLSRLARYLRHDRPFALCLAERVIDHPQHPLASLAAEMADKRFAESTVDFNTWSAAASLVADFGTPQQQARLLALLTEESQTDVPSPRYQAVVAGVTNRYTPNRIAYLKPLLEDRRQRPEPAASKYRYCDTAVARLTSITNEPILEEQPTAELAWEQGIDRARKWLVEHPEQAQLARLLPPTGNNPVRSQRIASPDDPDLRVR